MQVVALIGASGTGKSHRASFVADRYKAGAIIDDGLLIADGRIVAGYSAKREATRMAAVKRAIFFDSAHAQEVRSALSTTDPETLLVLGTSRNMVRRILGALALEAYPIQWVAIDDVASAADIANAQRVRRQEGKHVIPAPTLEVRKTFSGYIVAPLRFIFPGRTRPMVVEKSIVRPTYSSLGRFYIADTVVSAIAAYVARRVPGIGSVLRVVVQSGAGGVDMELEVTLNVTEHLFEVLETVQRTICRQIESSTALNVRAVQVYARRLEREERG